MSLFIRLLMRGGVSPKTGLLRLMSISERE
jgi:hypothetical protein